MPAKCDFRLFDPFQLLGDPDPFWIGFRGFLRQGLEHATIPTAPMTVRSARAPSQSPAVRLESEPEGWRVSAEAADFQSVVGATTGGWVALGRSPGFSGQIGSDKCDWRVVTPSVDMQGRGTDFVRDMKANFLGGQLTFGSAKRDWRVGAATTQVQAIAEVVRDRFTVEGRGAGFGGMVSTSKCDWRLGGEDMWGPVVLESDERGQELSIGGPMVESHVATEKGEWVLRTRGAERLGNQVPEVVTSVAVDEDTIRVRLTVGAPGGPRVYVGGFASAKCDFRFDAVEYGRPGEDFKPLLREADIGPAETTPAKVAAAKRTAPRARPTTTKKAVAPSRSTAKRPPTAQ